MHEYVEVTVEDHVVSLTQFAWACDEALAALGRIGNCRDGWIEAYTALVNLRGNILGQMWEEGALRVTNDGVQ